MTSFCRSTGLNDPDNTVSSPEKIRELLSHVEPQFGQVLEELRKQATLKWKKRKWIVGFRDGSGEIDWSSGSLVVYTSAKEGTEFYMLLQRFGISVQPPKPADDLLS